MRRARSSGCLGGAGGGGGWPTTLQRPSTTCTPRWGGGGGWLRPQVLGSRPWSVWPVFHCDGVGTQPASQPASQRGMVLHGDVCCLGSRQAILDPSAPVNSVRCRAWCTWTSRGGEARMAAVSWHVLRAHARTCCTAWPLPAAHARMPDALPNCPPPPPTHLPPPRPQLQRAAHRLGHRQAGRRRLLAAAAGHLPQRPAAGRHLCLVGERGGGAAGVCLSCLRRRRHDIGRHVGASAQALASRQAASPIRAPPLFRVPPGSPHAHPATSCASPPRRVAPEILMGGRNCTAAVDM